MKKLSLIGVIMSTILAPNISQLSIDTFSQQFPSRELRFQRYTAEDGLSDYIPFSANMIQDEKGFLWIPSFDGLNRFDGLSFKVYRNQVNKQYGPSNNTIYNLCEGPEGKIWIGLRIGLLNIFDPETETFQEIGDDFPPFEKSCVSAVKNLHRDQAGNMWLSTYKGICRCEPGTWKFKKYEFNGPRGAAFLQQQNGTIWVGTQKGMFRYLPDRDTFVFYEPYPDKPGSIPFNKASYMMEHEGEVWTTSKRKGQYIFNPGSEQFRDFPLPINIEGSAAKAMLKDSKGRLWFGNENFVSKYDPKTQKAEHYYHNPLDPTSCQEGSIIHMLQDQAGSIWSSSYPSGGLSVIHTLDNPFQELPPYNYLALCSLNDEQVILGTDKGFLVYNTRQERIVTDVLPPALASAVGDCIKLTSDQTLWWRDIQQKKVLGYNLLTGQKKEVNYNGKFVTDSKGNLWFNSKSISYYDRKLNRVKHLQKHIEQLEGSGLLNNEMINSINIDSLDRVWIGTSTKGLVLYNPSTETVQVIQHIPDKPYTLPKGNISLVFAGKKGGIYVRTDFGLSIYQPEKDSVININMPDGLPRHLIFPMIEGTNQQLWLGSTKGLTRLNTKDYSIQYFDEQDGLPHGTFDPGISGVDGLGFIYLSKGGTLFRFHPDSVHLKSFVAQVNFTDFYLNHERVLPGDHDSLLKKHILYQNEFVLNHKQNDFGFRFLSPTFYKAEGTQYYYKLENYDQDWVAIGNRNETHFTNIPAGNYHFKVKAKSAAGFWVEAPSIRSIIVLPPWWRTYWAYFIYILLTLIIIWFARAYELRNLKVKNESLRLLEMNQLKTRLFTNITHEFRTPLTVIQGMADQVEQYPQQSRQLIRRNAGILLRLVNQLLDMSKLESGKMELHVVQHNIIAFLRYLVESFRSYAISKDIVLDFQSEVQELVMDYDPDKVQHIMANLLSNAIKFSHEGGEVLVVISKTSSAVKPKEIINIQVIDKGMGIKPEDLPLVFDRYYRADTRDNPNLQGGKEGTGIGLAFTKELVSLLGGSISVKSEWTRGTEFKVTFPVFRQSGGLKKEEMITLPQQLQPIPDAEYNNGWPATVQSNLTKDNLPLLLIIEDNPDVVTYIQTCLKDKYDIRVAYDGVQGIEQSLALVPDIIISDVMMPNKDGYEATKFLKEDERTSHIPIVLLTAKADVSSRIEGLKRGADGYLSKPFNQEELMVRLEQLLALRKKLQRRYQNPIFQPPSSDPGLQIEDAFLKKVKAAVDAHLDDSNFGVSELCVELMMSQSQLFRKIKFLTGRSVAAYIRAIRLHHGRELLQNTQKNVSEVAYEVGFTDPKYFSKTFSNEFGVAPSKIGK